LRIFNNRYRISPAVYNRFEYHKNIKNLKDINPIFMAVNWGSNPGAGINIFMDKKNKKN